MVETHPCSEEWLAPANISDSDFRVAATLPRTEDFEKAWQMDGKKMMEVGKDFYRSLREGRRKNKGMVQGKLPAEGKKKKTGTK